MGFFSRLFGRCRTPMLTDEAAWRFQDGTLEIDLTKVAALEARGSAVRLEGDDLPDRVLVVHGLDGTYHAFPNRCKHAGRRIDPLHGAPGIECCSVGRSTYDYAGTRLSGSAKADIIPFPVRRDGNTLRIVLPPYAA